MDNINKPEKKKSSKWKLFVILLVVALIGGTVSLANPTIRSKADILFDKLPWSKGEETSSLTEEQESEKIEDLAEYYLSLDNKAAADKLYIIKNDNEILYSEIVRAMNKQSSSKTEEIIKLVRNLEGSKELLIDLHDSLIDEKNEYQNKEIQRLESQNIIVTVQEIENTVNSGGEAKTDLLNTISNMNEDTLANILHYIDEEVREEILNSLDDEKSLALENALMSKNNEELRLIDIANFYETKPLKVALEEIGNDETYGFEELGVIYSNLSLFKSAEIISNIDNDEFIQELYLYIRRDNSLNRIEPLTTKISEAIEFINEYNKKIRDLAKVYEGMSPSNVARIAENMMNNNRTVTSLELESNETFNLTDSKIIVDVLFKIDDKSLSSIINNMSTENASRLTQMLAKPADE